MNNLKKPEVIDGIKCYAPEVAISNDDFPAGKFEKLYNLEDKNFWFRSRNRVIKRLFKSYLGTGQDKKILEIGCGTGYVLESLSHLEYNLSGAEIHIEGLKYAKQRLPKADFIQLDATRMPFVNAFDAIGAFDVLEHIEQDELVMQQVYISLKKNGLFFITVPQYQWMWSQSDDNAMHKRRYSKKEMLTKLKTSGFKIEYSTSFIFCLFPFMYFSRLLQKKSKQRAESNDLSSGLDLNPIINLAFESITRVDELLIGAGMPLPFGGSLIVVARKD